MNKWADSDPATLRISMDSKATVRLLDTVYEKGVKLCGMEKDAHP